MHISFYLILNIYLLSPSDWLSDVGLPQYQQPFLDAKIDGRMLNSLSMVRTCHVISHMTIV